MANTTVRVPMGTSPFADPKVKRPVASFATLNAIDAAHCIFFPGAMVATDSSGNLQKAEDLTGLRFDGINAEADRVQVFSGDVAGDRKIDVLKPFSFLVAIAAAAAGDEGRAVYAVDDWHVGYTSTNSLLVGHVLFVHDATHVQVTPYWVGVGGMSQGAVTQITNKATGVTLNKSSGLITMNNAALNNNTTVTFALTDSIIAANDQVLVSVQSGETTAGSYQVWASEVLAGSVNINVRNVSGGGLSEALVLNFCVVKGGNN